MPLAPWASKGLPAREVAAELELMAYVEPTPGKRDTWQNTAAGNKVACVRPARLTRAKATNVTPDAAEIGAQALTPLIRTRSGD
jgi:hypothetical protein